MKIILRDSNRLPVGVFENVRWVSFVWMEEIFVEMELPLDKDDHSVLTSHGLKTLECCEMYAPDGDVDNWRPGITSINLRMRGQGVEWPERFTLCPRLVAIEVASGEKPVSVGFAGRKLPDADENAIESEPVLGPVFHNVLLASVVDNGFQVRYADGSVAFYPLHEGLAHCGDYLYSDISFFIDD